MNLKTNFNLLGFFDVSKIQRALSALPESAWLDTVAKAAPAHRQSRGLFLKNDLKPEHLYGTVRPMAKQLAGALDDVVAALRSCFGPSYLIRLQFSRHLPGAGFTPHTDEYSFTLAHSHRIHLPVFTNPKVWFSIGGERKNLREGEAWEIDNMRVHAGRNEGRSPRVHLIVDFAKPLVSVAQRLEYFRNLDFVVAGLRAGGSVLCRPQLEGERAPADAVETMGAPPASRGRVEKDLVVSVNYRLRDADSGETLAVDVSDEPLSYVHGRRQLPAGMERPLGGLKVAAKFSAVVPGALGYGVARAGHPFSGRRLLWEGRVRAIRALEPDEFRYAVYEGPTLPKPRRTSASSKSRKRAP